MSEGRPRELRIVGGARQAETLLRERAREFGGVTLELGVGTWGKFERRLLDEHGLTILEPAAARMLARALEEGAPHAARRRLDAWSVLRAEGVQLDQLEAVAQREREGSLVARHLRTLARFARKYEDRCRAAAVDDVHGARLRLLETWRPSAARAALHDARVVRISGLVEGWSRTRVQTLAALTELGLEVHLSLPRLQSEALHALRERIDALAPKVHVRLEEPAEAGTEASLSQLGHLLASGAALSPHQGLRFVGASDERAAAQRLATRLRRHLLGGESADELVVFVSRPEAFTRRWGHVFDAAGVPWTLRPGPSAVQSGPWGLVRALVELAEAQVPRAELVALLESERTRSGPLGIRPRRLAAALEHAGSRDDAGTGHVARLAAEGGADAKDLSERLGRLLRAIVCPERGRPELFAAWLETAFEVLGVESASVSRLGPGLGPEHARARGEALAHERAALASLRRAARDLSRWSERLELDEMDRRAWWENMQNAAARVATWGVRGGRVEIRRPREVWGASWRHVFTLGPFEAELLPEGASEEVAASLGRALGRRVGVPRVGGGWFAAWSCARESLTLARALHEPASRSRVLGEAAERLREAAVHVESAPNPEDQGLDDVHGADAKRAHAISMLRSRAPDHAGAREVVDQMGEGRRHRAHTRVRLKASSADAVAERVGMEGSGTELRWVSSATSLESYAQCPFRWFADRVAQLDGAWRGQDELTGAERGSLGHAALAASMRALAQARLLPLRGGAHTEREESVAWEAAEEAALAWGRAHRRGAAWSLQMDAVRRELFALLERERDQAKEGWLPTAFEEAFGESELALHSPAGEGRVGLRGRVDRVDVRGEGKSREALVVDYKSGSVFGRLNPASLGRSALQLPLYARWAGERFAAPVVDATYVSTRDGNRPKKTMLDLVQDHETLHELLEPAQESGEAAAGARGIDPEEPRRIEEIAWRLVHGIRSGAFDAAPERSATCRGCPHAMVCRIDEVEEADP